MLDDLNADYMIPVHYGAFVLQERSGFSSAHPEKLIAKKDNAGSMGGLNNKYSDRIKILDEGEQFIFGYTDK